ncbi:Heat shock factor protein [Symbiodinium microadriaticum]|uniref:Heat shock factor protein n=1 Tax=Symbiodinium microadriaticum TaxID=2951 RepID=A0A1Q9F7G1_SYMMI|nr:Heat shock factor protein [Symbiodinium microadriaticum]
MSVSANVSPTRRAAPGDSVTGDLCRLLFRGLCRNTCSSEFSDQLSTLLFTAGVLAHTSRTHVWPLPLPNAQGCRFLRLLGLCSIEGCYSDLDGELSLRQLRAVKRHDSEAAAGQDNEDEVLAQEGDQDLTKDEWGSSSNQPQYGSQYGSPYGSQYGSPYGSQYGSPYGSQYGSPYGSQGSQYGSQWGASYSNEKCCRCKSGSIGWSASGRCSFCHGFVEKTASVAPECRKSSPNFMGSHACAKACKSKVKSSWSWLETAEGNATQD